jgi:hypothetical protein
MIAEVLTFVSRSSRPALACLGVGVAVAYFVPDAALQAVGFSPTVTRLGAVGVQLAALTAILWPRAERRWAEARAKREAELANALMRRKCSALSDEAKFVFAYYVHSADDFIYLPMGATSTLELEGAGLLKRIETSSEVAKLYAPSKAKSWLGRDFAWAISNLELDSDKRVKFDKFAAGVEQRFYGRI